AGAPPGGAGDRARRRWPGDTPPPPRRTRRVAGAAHLPGSVPRRLRAARAGRSTAHTRGEPRPAPPASRRGIARPPPGAPCIGRGTPARALIVGDGPERGALQRQAAALGLD